MSGSSLDITTHQINQLHGQIYTFTGDSMIFEIQDTVIVLLTERARLLMCLKRQGNSSHRMDWLTVLQESIVSLNELLISYVDKVKSNYWNVVEISVGNQIVTLRLTVQIVSKLMVELCSLINSNVQDYRELNIACSFQ